MAEHELDYARPESPRPIPWIRSAIALACLIGAFAINLQYADDEPLMQLDESVWFLHSLAWPNFLILAIAVINIASLLWSASGHHGLAHRLYLAIGIIAMSLFVLTLMLCYDTCSGVYTDAVTW